MSRLECPSALPALEDAGNEKATWFGAGRCSAFSPVSSMIDRELRDQFLAAGVPEAQVDAVLGYFDLYGGAAEITSEAEYRNGMAIYAASDAHLAPHDVHSAVARYVIHLGTRLAEWDDGHASSGKSR